MPDEPLRILITAGPTHETIDAVRFIGNRSSGRLGRNLADEAAERGWDTTLCLGPVMDPTTSHGRVRTLRFASCADLERLLEAEMPKADVLVMAAAVSDYRPIPEEADPDGKRRRTGEDMVLRLESTPDLLAGCAARRRPGQLLIGFALEPADQMIASARRKLERKNVDAIVANPLETMDAGGIRATLVARPELGIDGTETDGKISKTAFASWLLDIIEPLALQTRAKQQNHANA